MTQIQREHAAQTRKAAAMNDKARPKSAAERAAQIERGHLASKASSAFSSRSFPELGVTVQGGKVYRGTGLLKDELGDLAGACAGVIDVRRPSPMAGLLTGVPPKLGTTFVRCSNGAEQQRKISDGFIAGAAWNRARQAIRDFNAMADAVRDS